jgi:hypothetical protein
MTHGRDRDLPDLTDLILLLMKRQRPNVPLKKIQELGPRFLDLSVFSEADLRPADSDAAWRDHLQFHLRRWYLSLDDAARERAGLSANTAERDVVARLLRGEIIESVPGGSRDARRVAIQEATAMALALLGPGAEPARWQAEQVAPKVPNSIRRLLLADPQPAATLDPVALRLGSARFDGRLPPYAPRLRDDELMAAVRDSKRRLTVVVGPPKAGKSRSLLNALQTGEPEARVWWVNSATGVLAELASELERAVGGMGGSPPTSEAPPRFIVLDDLQRCGVNPTSGLNDDVLERLTRHAHVLATLHEDELAGWDAGGYDRSARGGHAGGASRQLIDQFHQATILLSPKWQFDELAGVIETLQQSPRRIIWGDGELPAGAERLAEFLAAVDELSAKASLALHRGSYEGALVHATVDATILYRDGCVEPNLQTLTAWHLERLEPTREWDTSGFANAFHWAQTPIGGPGSPHAILQRESRNGQTVWRLLDALTSSLRDEIDWTPLSLVGVELPDEDLLRLATILFDHDEDDVARSIRARLSEAGNSEAMVELSHQLRRERKEGWAEWHNKSFEAGNSYALNWAGLSWLAEGDIERARTRLEEASAAGYAPATERLVELEDGERWRLRSLDKVQAQFDRGLITRDEFLQEFVESSFCEPDGRDRPGAYTLEAQHRFLLDHGAPLDVLSKVLETWKKPLDWVAWPRELAYEQLAAVARPEILVDERAEDEPDGLRDLLVSFGWSWPLPEQWEWIVTAPSLPPLWCSVAAVILQGRDSTDAAMATAQEALDRTGCWDPIRRVVTRDETYEWWEEPGRIEELLAALNLTRLVGDGNFDAATEIAVLAAAANQDRVAREICSRIPIDLSHAAITRTCQHHCWHRWTGRTEISAWLVILDLLYGADTRAAKRLKATNLAEVGGGLGGLHTYLQSAHLPTHERVSALRAILLRTENPSVAGMASHELKKLGIKLTEKESELFRDHVGRNDPWGRVLVRFVDRPMRRS